MPLRTPPETGLRIGFGPGLGGGSSSITIGSGWFVLTFWTFTSTGPDASFAAEVEAEGKSATTAAFLVFLPADFESGLLTGAAATGAAGCGFVADYLSKHPEFADLMA